MKKILIMAVILFICFGGAYLCYNHIMDSRDGQLFQNKDVDGNKNNSHDIILLKVLNNEKEFIDKDNNSIMFRNYIIGNEGAVAKEYAFVDLDNDNETELVVNITSDYGAYMIFKYDDGKVYGHMIDNRSFENLKEDGSFIGSNGVGTEEYLKITFSKNKYNMITEAIYDEVNNVYKIKDKNVTKEEINEYINTWNKKKSIEYKNI